jgi:Streptogramin lyase
MRFVMFLGVAAAGTLWAQGPYVTFRAYPVPGFPDHRGPYGIIPGADGALWLQGHFDAMARLTTEGVVTSYPIPNSMGWLPGSITPGPDGALWFTESGVNRIARMTTSGEVTEYDIPSLPSGAITTGPDGSLWFSEDNKIGRLTTAGAVSEYPLPKAEWCAGAIAAGPDGALWFAESSACGSVVNGTTTVNAIGRIATDGTITEYALPGASFQGVWFIVAGPDGAMWFNEYYAGKIGRITMQGMVTEYPFPSLANGVDNGAGPTSIAPGPDGALWFPESNDDYFVRTLGRITTDGVITEYDVPLQNINYSAAITMGPDGALWFTDGWTSNVMRAEPRPGFAVANGLLPFGHAGNVYSATLVATGGTMPYTWAIVGGALPDALSFDPGTGIIEGTASSAGVANFTVQVTDSSNPALSATQALSISIAR